MRSVRPLLCKSCDHSSPTVRCLWVVRRLMRRSGFSAGRRLVSRPAQRGGRAGRLHPGPGAARVPVVRSSGESVCRASMIREKVPCRGRGHQAAAARGPAGPGERPPPARGLFALSLGNGRTFQGERLPGRAPGPSTGCRLWSRAVPRPGPGPLSGPGDPARRVASRPPPRGARALTGQVKPKGKRMGLLKAGSAPSPSGRLKESVPSTGVTKLP